MPRARSQEPLYQRGKYRLIKRPGRTNLEIIWYDPAAGRERSRSAGTAEIREGEEALDALFLEKERGQSICPTCRRPWDDNRRFLLIQSMLDYDLSRRSRPSYEAINARLAWMHEYLETTDQQQIGCEDIDQDWIKSFEEWAIEIPVTLPNGKIRDRAPGTVNNSVVQVAAAVNFSHNRRDTLFPAGFKARQPKDVNRTPAFRASIAQIADMFAYALEHPVKRANLLNYLRIATATLVRPEHAHYVDVSPAKGMWDRQHEVINLLPRNQVQSKKRRPILPAPRQAVPWLNSERGQIIPVNSIASSWTTMRKAIALPGEGQAGPKLIRRSVAKLMRDRMDKRDVPELEAYLGHRIIDESTDIYAPADPDYLSRARAALESVIDDIEVRVPAAYYRNDTAQGGKVISIGRVKSA